MSENIMRSSRTDGSQNKDEIRVGPNMLQTGTGEDSTCQRIRMLRINNIGRGCFPHSQCI